MPSPVIGFPNRAGALLVFAQQAVDQGRFADARRADQNDGLSRSDLPSELCQTLAGDRADRNHLEPGSGLASELNGRSRVFDEIRLAEHHDSPSAPDTGQREEPLDSP